MKSLIILLIFITIALIALLFYKNRDIKKLTISIVIFTLISMFAGLGNMTRSIIPLFISHFILVSISWGSFLVYIITDKLYIKVILLPITTLVTYLLLVYLVGS
jgi:hypothetical protein